METDQSRERQQQIRGARPEPQNRGAHPRARQQVRGSESAPTDRAGQQAMNSSIKRTFTRATVTQVRGHTVQMHEAHLKGDRAYLRISRDI